MLQYLFFLFFLTRVLILDIGEAVKAKKILPNEWLILRFDFSMLDRSEDPGLAQLSLRNCINDCIKTYCQVYHKYLGYATITELLSEVLNSEDPIASLKACIRCT